MILALVVVIKRLFNDVKSKMIITTGSKLRLHIEIMLKPHKQSSMVWIGIVLISSLALSVFLPTPTAIGIFILWAFFVYLYCVLHKFIGGKQKGIHDTSNITSYNHNYDENVVLTIIV